jgi:hypothetical protein
VELLLSRRSRVRNFSQAASPRLRSGHGRITGVRGDAEHPANDRCFDVLDDRSIEIDCVFQKN